MRGRPGQKEVLESAQPAGALPPRPQDLAHLSYGKSTNAKHPVTGRIENRSTDKSKWTEVHFPDLAIVTVEQWERVQAITKTLTDFGAHRLGGMGRRDKSAPIPLFSGLLVCGSCEGAYVVTNKTSRAIECSNARTTGSIRPVIIHLL